MRSQGRDIALVNTVRAYDLLDRIGAYRLQDTLAEALDAFRRDDSASL